MTSFGHAARSLWALDPDVLYLNHGTVGAPPRRVLAAQQAIRDEIERQPSQFLLRELSEVSMGTPVRTKPRLRQAADRVAAFLGARGSDLVFTNNATTGVNAVLRSLDFEAGDEILIHDMAYGAIAKTAEYIARVTGATVKTVTMPYPVLDPKEWVLAIDAACTARTKVAILDHITSDMAVVLPLAAIAKACHARGVAVIVDGAHAPGAIALDLPSLGVDWYAANLHKWCWSPRSCAILWAPAERQKELHPTVISWGLDQGFTSEFDWVGTYDPSAALAAPEGIAMMEEIGVERIRTWNHDLAWKAANLLAARFGTTLGVTEAMVGTMATVPLPEAYGSTREEGQRLRDLLLLEDRIEVAVPAWRGRLWVRICAQIYNEMSDYERLADAVARRASYAGSSPTARLRAAAR